MLYLEEKDTWSFVYWTGSPHTRAYVFPILRLLVLAVNCFASLMCPLPNLQVFLPWSQCQLVIYILVTNPNYLSLQISAKSYLHKSSKYLLLLTQSSCLPLCPCWLSYHGTSVHVLLMFLYDLPYPCLFAEITSTATFG